MNFKEFLIEGFGSVRKDPKSFVGINSSALEKAKDTLRKVEQAHKAGNAGDAVLADAKARVAKLSGKSTSGKAETMSGKRNLRESPEKAKAEGALKNALLAKLNGKGSAEAVVAARKTYSELVGADRAKTYVEYVKKSHAEKGGNEA